MENEQPTFNRDNCIKIDIDVKDFANVSNIIMKRGYIFKKFELTVKGIFVFKSAHGWHIYIELEDNEKFKELTIYDIVFFQAIIGSDFKREILNWMRAKSGMGREWNILFVEKYDAVNKKMISQEQYFPELGERLMKMLAEKEGM
jgi:hypothetical protein